MESEPADPLVTYGCTICGVAGHTASSCEYNDTGGQQPAKKYKQVVRFVRQQ